MMPATFAAVFIALYVGHQVGDHWIQSDHQAKHKAETGTAGRLACAAHVGTYTATQAVTVALAAWALGLTLSPALVATGFAISALTHYIADRRVPLRILADTTGKGAFWRLAQAGMNGAYQLDQSWHIGWLFVAALVMIL